MLRRVKEAVRCPVCDGKLGERWIEEATLGYCEECCYTFYFKANANVPHKNQRGKPTNEDSRCNCGRCGR